MTSFSGPVGIATTVNDMVEEVNTSMADESFSDRAMTMLFNACKFCCHDQCQLRRHESASDSGIRRRKITVFTN